MGPKDRCKSKVNLHNVNDGGETGKWTGLTQDLVQRLGFGKPSES
jgi:hypothetical protein